ncbi:MAG TPA: selenium metabolism-associated LysR family transcriptional regulator [Nitrospinota bacterium]|nr:selenium metabolism-associated LysR family transcriptional regulator [Nitrospinota bacterium]
MLDCRDLEILSKIIELKSFSKAAEELYLTQPTISGHIIELEKRLGIKLLDRLGKEILPTKAGSLLYNYSKRILKLRAEAEQALEHFKSRFKGKLFIGGSTIPGVYILPSLIEQFNKKHPEISITLKLSDSKGTFKNVLEGTIEIGVIGARIKNNKIEYNKFFDDEIILICSKNHDWTKKDSISLNNLKKESFISRERGSGTRITMEKELQSHHININDFNVVAEMENNEAIKQGVKCGLGVSFISKRAVEDELIKGTLKKVKIRGVKIKRVFYIIRRKGKTLSPLCSLFFNFLSKSS